MLYLLFHLGTVMKLRKSLVYDVLHKSTVTLIIGFSAVSCGYIGYRALRWFVGMHYFCYVFCVLSVLFA